MARINVEDSIFRDPRFVELAGRVGGMDCALGALVRAWGLAQAWYVTPEGLIPLSAWDAQRLPRAIIDAGLADVVGEKVRMRGLDEHCSWLKRRRQASKNGGLKTQENRRKQKEAKVSKTKGSFSVSVSVSSSDSVSSSKNEERNLSAGSPPSGAWDGYREAYRTRYGQDPLRNAMVNGQLKQFAARVPAGEAAEIAGFYVRHNDQFYVRQMHPVGLLLKDAEKLRTEWASGTRMTTTRARETEKRQTLVDTWGPLIAEAEAKDGKR